MHEKVKLMAMCSKRQQAFDFCSVIWQDMINTHDKFETCVGR